MTLRAGDIVILFDGTAPGEVKPRMFLCLAPEDGYFARITAKPRGRQPVPLRQGYPDCISKDCFIETGIPLEFSDDEIEAALARQGIAGTLDRDQVQGVIEHWRRVMSTPPAAQHRVIAALSDRYGL